MPLHFTMQQFPATGHFALYKSTFSRHIALCACLRQDNAKMMPSKRAVETWCTRQDDAEVEPYNTWIRCLQKRHVYILCVYTSNDAVKVAFVYVHCVYLKTEWHVHIYTLCTYIRLKTMPRKRHAYTLCIRQNDALKMHVYTSWRRRRRGHVVETMSWKNNFQRQQGQDVVEDVARPNIKKTTWKGHAYTLKRCLGRDYSHPDDVAERKMHVLTSRRCRGRSIFKGQDATMEGGPRI